MNEQVHRFDNGGYVVHRITGSYKGRVSAWFDAAGNMLDAEYIYPGQGGAWCTVGVKRGAAMWRHAESVGRRLMPVTGWESVEA